MYVCMQHHHHHTHTHIHIHICMPHTHTRVRTDPGQAALQNMNERVGPGRLTEDGCAYVGEARQERAVGVQLAAAHLRELGREQTGFTSDKAPIRQPAVARHGLCRRGREDSHRVCTYSKLCGRRVESAFCAHGARYLRSHSSDKVTEINTSKSTP